MLYCLQVEAVRFLWDCVCETVERSNKEKGGGGCILAHCMGLGKTLSVSLQQNTNLSLSLCILTQAVVYANEEVWITLLADQLCVKESLCNVAFG